MYNNQLVLFLIVADEIFGNFKALRSTQEMTVLDFNNSLHSKSSSVYALQCVINILKLGLVRELYKTKVNNLRIVSHNVHTFNCSGNLLQLQLLGFLRLRIFSALELTYRYKLNLESQDQGLSLTFVLYKSMEQM